METITLRDRVTGREVVLEKRFCNDWWFSKGFILNWHFPDQWKVGYAHAYPNFNWERIHG